MKFLTLLLTVFALSACKIGNDGSSEPVQKRDPDSGLVFSRHHLITLDNGCWVEKIKSENNFQMYVTYCPFASTNTHYQCGKVQCSSPLLPFSDNVPAIKKQALSKLSKDERRVLGLEEEDVK